MRNGTRQAKAKSKLVLSLLAGSVSILPVAPALGQTWTGASDNNWFNGANWSGGVAPDSASSAAVINVATNNPVMLSSSATVSTLTLGSGDSLTQTAGVFYVEGGAISNAGAFGLGGQMQLGADLTLTGSGTLTLDNGAIGADSYSGRMLTNGSTIEGSGVIGSNSGALYETLALDNTGTIDANSSGATLTIGGNGGSMVNSNLLEATNGGILDLAAVTPLDNAGGAITASGTGSTVTVDMQVQGGTLNTSGGGVIETGNSGAYLDGATNGAITLSNGSIYTAGSNALTRAMGTLDLASGATVALTGQLQVNGGDLTLAGPGALVMSGSAQIGADSYGGRTLNNGATIEGYGLIDSDSGSLYNALTTVNQSGGVILANVAGQTLTIAASGALTNDGLMQADAGAALHAEGGFTNFSGGTLTGGAYDMYSGVIQIDALGTTGGEIATNQASILLNGPTAALTDASGLNALSNLSTNASGASLTVQNGYAFATTAPSTFINNGALSVGSGSTFATLADYSQSGSGASTLVDGTLTPGSGNFAMTGGVLTGSGEVAAEVTNTGGLVNPGDPIGTLRTLGYTQGSAGTLEIEIANASSNDVLDVLGLATLDGQLDPVLKSGFTPTLGQSFTFLDYTSRIGQFAGIENDVFDDGRYMWGVTYNPTDAVLTVEAGPGGGGTGTVSAAPEPPTWMLLIMSVGGIGMALRRAGRRLSGRRSSVAAA